MRRLLLMTTALIALAAPASAATLPLTLDSLQSHLALGQQAQIHTCIISGTVCGQQLNFGYDNFKQGGNISAYNLYSTDQGGKQGQNIGSNPGVPYTAGEIVSAVGGTQFVVGIDTNTNKASDETLTLFDVIDTTQGNRILYEYSCTDPVHCTGNIGAASNNGNGFADFGLFTVDLLAPGLGIKVNASDGILFHAVWNNASAGAEQFFLFQGAGPTQFCTDPNGCGNPPPPPPVPGPIVGAGIPGLIAGCLTLLGLARRRLFSTAA